MTTVFDPRSGQHLVVRPDLALPFDRALEWVLHIEGGYVDNPSDPGGATFAGVSLRAIVGLRDVAGELQFDLDHDGDVDAADVRALKDHPELVADFYRREYWEPAGGPRLPWPVALLAMDGAVNHGPGPGVVLVQQALGVPADGKVGLHTAQAAATADIARVLTEYQARRGVLYAHVTVNRVAKLLAQGVGREQAIAQGEVFLLGWMRRLALLMAEARG